MSFSSLRSTIPEFPPPIEDLYLRAVITLSKLLYGARAYLRGGFRGFKPPQNFQIFFLKSEGKEIERKKMRTDGRRGLIVNTFLGSEIFLSGAQIFPGGIEKFSRGFEKFSGRVEKFSGGG